MLLGPVECGQSTLVATYASDDFISGHIGTILETFANAFDVNVSVRRRGRRKIAGGERDLEHVFIKLWDTSENVQVLSTISHKIRYPNCVLLYFAVYRYLDEIPVLAARWLPIVKRPSRKRIVIRK